MEAVIDCILGDSKTSVDSGCNHEIKRYLLLGMKAMTNLDSVLKSRDLRGTQKNVNLEPRRWV